MLSTTAEYALRIMTVLADRDLDVASTSESIAKFTRVPPDYAVKVLQMLARAGLVSAQRGRGGGFKLACDPAATTLLDVVNAIEPIQRIKSCPLEREAHSDQLCPLHTRIDQIGEMLETSFAAMTLSDVVNGQPGPPLCSPTSTGITIGGS